MGKAEKQHKKNKMKKGKAKKDDSEPHAAGPTSGNTVQEVEFEPEPEPVITEPEVTTEPEPSPRPQQEKKNKKLVVEEVETIIEPESAPVVEVKVAEVEPPVE